MIDGNSTTLKIDIVGVFFDEQNLRAAMHELNSAGIEYTQMGLLCTESALQEKLDHLYQRIKNDANNTDSPDMEFVEAEAVGDTPYAALGAMSFIGGAVGGGAIVATVGVLGSALAVATAGTAVVGGLAVIASELLSKSDAEALQEQLDAGHILLFVRVGENKLKDKVIEILKDKSGITPHKLAPVADSG